MAEIGANERYSELEKKVHHLQSRVDAYSSSNNSEVILRLQSEVSNALDLCDGVECVVC